MTVSSDGGIGHSGRKDCWVGREIAREGEKSEENVFQSYPLVKVQISNSQGPSPIPTNTIIKKERTSFIISHTCTRTLLFSWIFISFAEF